MRHIPDDDFIGYDIADPQEAKRQQVIVAPNLTGAFSDNKWLLIAAAAVALLVILKKK